MVNSQVNHWVKLVQRALNEVGHLRSQQLPSFSVTVLRPTVWLTLCKFLHVSLHVWLTCKEASRSVTNGSWCASGCVVECWICNQEVAGSNLGRGYFAPRSTQHSIPPGSVNEYQLQLGRQRQVWLSLLVDEMQGVQVKLCHPVTMRAIPEHLRDVSCGGVTQINFTSSQLPV